MSELAQPATVKPAADQAAAEVDQVGQPHRFDLATACQLAADVVVTIDRLRAAVDAVIAPAMAVQQLPREFGAVLGVDPAA